MANSAATKKPLRKTRKNVIRISNAMRIGFWFKSGAKYRKILRE
jgi:hypothetical protein